MVEKNEHDWLKKVIISEPESSVTWHPKIFWTDGRGILDVLDSLGSLGSLDILNVLHIQPGSWRV